MLLKSGPCAFLFPGQGSQTVGMGRALVEAFPIAWETFTQADDILGIPLSRLVWEGPREILDDTVNTQPALLVHSIAAWRVLRLLYSDLVPSFIAGHSMGEFSALVAADALTYPDALRLVRTRGELMKAAGLNSPGGMAAILGLDLPTMEEICGASNTAEEQLQVANDNCPGQVVISGSRAAVERALEKARQAGARRAVPLAVSIAAHSPLMGLAQEGFNYAVEQVSLNDPSIPIIGNVTAQLLITTGQIRADLKAQLTSRVRWTESIQYMTAQGVKIFLELGNETVLTGLLKRIDREAIGIPLGNPEDFDKLKK